MVHPANCKVSFETLGIFFLDSPGQARNIAKSIQCYDKKARKVVSFDKSIKTTILSNHTKAHVGFRNPQRL